MAVKIRLKRIGMKKHPFYRVVVADEHSPRDGRFIEEIGYYDPMTQPATVKIDSDKAQLWLGRGAQPTDTARILLRKIGALAPDPRFAPSQAAKPAAAAAEA
ncbi:MAG: 30S ribosomal protein S16 [Oscillospiraceae bacterium]|jgi:small subunit ribosomal protein S16|nr:30S ribosomal protein S16 [Oscillospiraceae bacterium]